MMNTKTIIRLFAAALLSTAPFSEAQEAKKVSRIGFLLVGGFTDTSRADAFRQGLQQLGYVEGKNIVIEWRRAEGKLDRLDELAAELVRLKVDVFVTSGNAVTRAAKKATSTIPIVTSLVSDPVENGFIASLARPGGNITGLTSLGAELSGKRLELLKETIPRLSRVMVLGNSHTPGNSQAVQQTETVARVMGVQLIYKDVQTVTDIDAAFKTLSKNRSDAVFMLPNAVLLAHRRRVVELTIENRLPMMYDAKEYVQIGGLISYAADAEDLFRRSSIYVDKILKGAKPADLPVEQPKKFEFVINLKTAKQIGLTIPPNVLARADKVIK
jgi:putative tryptophan/tyrosine transport system substrate-binding protein